MAGADGAIHDPWRMEEVVFDPNEEVKELDLTLDSGATNHMIRDFGFVRKFRYLSPPIPIQVADGFEVSATAIGNIDTEFIELEDVFVVPELKMNLVSVHQLASRDIFITFGKNFAELYKEGERVGGAIADGGLYKLRFLKETAPHTSPADAPHTSPAEPRELITYAANAVCSMKKDLVPSFKNLLVDWVTSIESPAVPADWATSFEHKSLIPGDLFALTAEMDASGEAGDADSCNMIKDGSFVPGKAHTGSDGMHGGDFMRVQLKEHCLNA